MTPADTIGFLLLGLLVGFAAVVWPTRKAAQLVGAENTGYGTVILALVLSIILMIGLAFLLGALSMGRGGGIGAGLALLAAVAYLYSKMFGTGMLGGFLIMLIAHVIGTVVVVGLGLVLGIGGSLFGGSDLDPLTKAADAVCACDGNKACMEVNSATFQAELERLSRQRHGPDDLAAINDRMAHYTSCMASAATPAPAPAASAPAVPAAPEAPAAPQAEPEAKSEPETKPAAPPPAQRFVWTWQESDLDQLPRRVGSAVRLELKDGRVREGVLTAITAEAASLRSREARGLSYDVTLSTVKSVFVYTRGVE